MPQPELERPALSADERVQAARERVAAATAELEAARRILDEALAIVPEAIGARELLDRIEAWLAGPRAEQEPARPDRVERKPQPEAPIAAAEPSDELQRARALVAQAQQALEAGAGAAAAEPIEAELAREHTPLVEGYLAYSLGWILEQASRAKLAPGQEAPDASWAKGLLERAAQAYRRVLALFPDHPRAAQRLARVLRELGRSEEAAELLAAALSQETGDPLAPADRYRLGVLLGELYAELGELDAARVQLAHAFQIRPGEDAAPRALLALHARVEERWAVPMLATCARFEEHGRLDFAAQGYAELMRRAAAGGELGPEAEAALVRWSEIEARRGALSLEALGTLPSPEGWPLLAELRSVLAHLDGGAEGAELWRATPERRAALAEVLRAQSAELERAEELPEALAALEQGFQLAQGARQLDAAADLARLLQRHPELDPGGQRFAALEAWLREREPEEEGDPETLRRAHAVLGLVYVERGAWELGSPAAAPSHLQRAVELGREAESAPALPHLSRELAAGLSREGHRSLAAQSYVDAAEGYAEIGDEAQSEGMLRELELHADAASPEVLRRADELSRRLRRGRPREGSAPAVPPRSGPWPWSSAVGRVVRPRPHPLLGFYFGGSGGYAHGNAGRDSFDGLFKQTDLPPSALRLDDESAAWKAFAGYKFPAPVAIELFYGRLGRNRFDAHFPATSAVLEVDERVQAGGVRSLFFLVDTPAHSLGLSAGAFAWENEIRVDPIEGGRRRAHDSGFGAVVGALWVFRIGLGFRGRLEVERYLRDGGDDIDLASVGLQYGW